MWWECDVSHTNWPRSQFHAAQFEAAIRALDRNDFVEAEAGMQSLITNAG